MHLLGSSSWYISHDQSFVSILTPFFQETGYVLISDVEVRTIVLPSLQIIWGRDLIKQYGKEEAFALLVIESKMHTLELPALRGKKPVFLSQGFALKIAKKWLDGWAASYTSNFLLKKLYQLFFYS